MTGDQKTVLWCCLGGDVLQVLIGSGIAFLSAICGWFISYRWQLRNYRLAVDADRARWNQGVERWAAEVIDVMTRMHAHFDHFDHQEAIEKSKELATSLSVLVDQGRLYFPNVMRDLYGEEKQQSRQGYRSAVLDPLVAAVKVSQGVQPEFDLPDIKRKYGDNRNSKALRLYLNAFLSLVERVLLVEASHQKLVARLSEVGNREEAQQLQRLLCPPTSSGAVPSGHRYWLGQESGRQIPSDSVILK